MSENPRYEYEAAIFYVEDQIQKHLTERGERGWELVTVLPVSRTGRECYWKRPIGSDGAVVESP